MSAATIATATDLGLLLQLLLPPLMCVCKHKVREGVGGWKT